MNELQELFLRGYSDEESEMVGLNNIKVDKIVFATQKNAIRWFDDYFEKHQDAIMQYRRSEHHQLQITLNDGARIISAPIHDSARGYRYRSVVLDYLNIPWKVFQTVILPCGYACSKDNVEFIDYID